MNKIVTVGVVPEEWKVGIGHDFRHYKGKMYRLIGLAPHSETLEPMDDGKS